MNKRQRTAQRIRKLRKELRQTRAVLHVAQVAHRTTWAQLESLRYAYGETVQQVTHLRALVNAPPTVIREPGKTVYVQQPAQVRYDSGLGFGAGLLFGLAL